MKILSVDYDYFQDVDAETIHHCYPDGVDLPTDITKITWAGYYARPNISKQLENVGLLLEEFETLKSILLKQDPNVPVLVVNSHINIYGFIHDYCRKEERHIIDHIDMHHDMFNDNPELDCGNWLSHILSDYEKNIGIRWISNPISLQTFGFSKEIAETERNGTKLFPTSLSDIKEDKFDLVFLCRSDTWTPPHLDAGFNELVEVIRSHFINYEIEKSVAAPRNIEPLVKQIKSAYEKMQGA